MKNAANKMTNPIDLENEARGVLGDSELKWWCSTKMAHRVGPNKSNVDKMVSKEFIEALDLKIPLFPCLRILLDMYIYPKM